jgi:hypothetical protein
MNVGESTILCNKMIELNTATRMQLLISLHSLLAFPKIDWPIEGHVTACLIRPHLRQNKDQIEHLTVTYDPISTTKKTC